MTSMRAKPLDVVGACTALSLVMQIQIRGSYGVSNIQDRWCERERCDVTHSTTVCEDESSTDRGGSQGGGKSFTSFASHAGTAHARAIVTVLAALATRLGRLRVLIAVLA